MNNHYDPNQPRNAEGEWTDAGGAIQRAASDEKGIIIITDNKNLEDNVLATLKANDVEVTNYNNAMSGSVYIDTPAGKIRIADHPANNMTRLPADYEIASIQDLKYEIPKILKKQNEIKVHSEFIKVGSIVSTAGAIHKFEVVKDYGNRIRVKNLSSGKEFDSIKAIYKPLKNK